MAWQAACPHRGVIIIVVEVPILGDVDSPLPWVLLKAGRERSRQESRVLPCLVDGGENVANSHHILEAGFFFIA